MKRTMILVALVLVAAIAAAQTRTVGPKSDCDAIIKLLTVDYAEAANRGDPDLRMSLWDREAIRFMPDLSILDITGLEKRVRSNMAANNSSMWVRVDEVMVFGDFAYASGPYWSKSVSKANGKETVSDGRYMDVYRRQPDGSWKIYREMTATK